MKITDKLTAPMAIVPPFIGGVIWLTSVDTTGKSNNEKITELKQQIKYLTEEIDHIDERLSRIEGKLDIIIDNNHVHERK